MVYLLPKYYSNQISNKYYNIELIKIEKARIRGTSAYRSLVVYEVQRTNSSFQLLAHVKTTQMTARSLLLLASACALAITDSAVDPAPRRLITKSLVLNNGLDWGKWGDVEYCVDGSFAQDFELKFEDYGLIDADETAVNSMKVYCSSKDGQHTGYITSTEGTKGDWIGMKTCPNGFMTGFRARILQPQGMIGDDVAIQNAEMECNYGESTVIGIDETVKIPDGDWSNWATCDNGSAICGVEVRYEAVDLFIDDTAVTDISLFCCALEEPPVEEREA
ncbi:hypothetical protein SK128_005238 [Halocaridina rubra]|uniref:Vitelline membrane outer layer protein 1 n=1 Tax=Halocaridina rubra TaxID=373956 RepID=A0AAN8WH55_HALRR